MKRFIHEDPESRELFLIVAEEAGIDAALIEKDYWVTHCLWALHQAKLEVYFKGGTSRPLDERAPEPGGKVVSLRAVRVTASTWWRRWRRAA